MAEMIPETLPKSSTAGERRVFAALARLPDECLVYYEPVVRRRYPDLIDKYYPLTLSLSPRERAPEAAAWVD